MRDEVLERINNRDEIIVTLFGDEISYIEREITEIIVKYLIDRNYQALASLLSREQYITFQLIFKALTHINPRNKQGKCYTPSELKRAMTIIYK